MLDESEFDERSGQSLKRTAVNSRLLSNLEIRVYTEGMACRGRAPTTTELAGSKLKACLIVDARSSLALMRAGIPQSEWTLIDMVGDAEAEANMAARLSNNGLTSEGTSTPRITGSGSNASTLIGAGTIPPPGP
jgi:hypothetical protein